MNKYIVRMLLFLLKNTGVNPVSNKYHLKACFFFLYASFFLVAESFRYIAVFIIHFMCALGANSEFCFPESRGKH